ncbi:Leucine-rich repeat - like 10 [Theobroma cacao]|nr:Leucine-rich repeat - like 10 [Theobroma cacao]
MRYMFPLSRQLVANIDASLFSGLKRKMAYNSSLFNTPITVSPFVLLTLDFSYSGLSGPFNSIFRLRYLQRLKLAGNNFEMMPIPHDFDRLAYLTHHNRSHSCFSGEIPSEISRLTRLLSLDLSGQRDYCPDSYHPLELQRPNFEIFFQKLSSLLEVYPDDADIFEQGISFCKALSRSLHNLRILSLSNCDLSGPVCSSFSELRFLSHLNLDNNNLHSLPPKLFANSSHLVSLSLANSSLIGSFPDNIFQLPRLQSLDISENPLLAGRVPQFSSNNTWKFLSLHETNSFGRRNLLVGELEEFHNSSSSPLKILILEGNNLKGPIPRSIFELPRLNVLSLACNNFNGSLKLGIFLNLKSLKVFDLSGNNLSSQNDKTSSTSLPQLQELHLSYCNITEFPSFLETQNSLEFLNLSNNKIHGDIPSWIWKANLSLLDLSYIIVDFPEKPFVGIENSSKSIFNGGKNSSFAKLYELQIRSCDITRFPDQFLKRNQENLWNLDLTCNRISGPIPNSIWGKDLYHLNLSSNLLNSWEIYSLNQSLSIFALDLQTDYLQGFSPELYAI